MGVETLSRLPKKSPLARVAKELYNDADFYHKYMGASTPGKPNRRHTGKMSSAYSVQALFLYGRQTLAKKRKVYASPAKAFAGMYKSVTMSRTSARLTSKLIDIAVEEKVMQGYSAACIATAWLMAAQVALGEQLVLPDTVRALGIYPRAAAFACSALKAKMVHSAAAVWAVVDANGVLARFPGLPNIAASTRITEPTSILTILKAKVAARGASCLSIVTSACVETDLTSMTSVQQFTAASNAIPDFEDETSTHESEDDDNDSEDESSVSESDAGTSISEVEDDWIEEGVVDDAGIPVNINGMCAASSDCLNVGIQAAVEGDGLLLPDFEYAFAYSGATLGQCRSEEGRVVSAMGFALGQFVF